MLKVFRIKPFKRYYNVLTPYCIIILISCRNKRDENFSSTRVFDLHVTQARFLWVGGQKISSQWFLLDIISLFNDLLKFLCLEGNWAVDVLFGIFMFYFNGYMVFSYIKLIFLCALRNIIARKLLSLINLCHDTFSS